MNLYPYQTKTAEWLTTKRFALVAHEQGLGKSAIAISAAQKIQAERILIVCPASVRPSWQAEFPKFWEGTVFPFIRTRKLDPIKDIEIVSYDWFTRNHTFYAGHRLDLLILDEAHYVKNPKSQRTRVLFGASGFCHSAHRTWCLTGTPMPNHAAELWPFLFISGQTKLKYNSFIQKYCTYYEPRPYTLAVTGTKREAFPEIQKMLEPVMIRSLKKDVLTELPPISFHSLPVDGSKIDLDPETIEKLTLEYRALEEKLGLNDFGFNLKSPERLVSLLEGMAPALASLRRYTGMRKALSVAKLVADELDSGAYSKIILFGVHRDVLETVFNHFEAGGFCPVMIHGGTSLEGRREAVERFQNQPFNRVFIGNIKAAGTGITLTAANQVVFIEQEWTPGDNAQAAMRAHRIGQMDAVTVRFVSLANSLDQAIEGILRRKSEEIAGVLDAMSPPPVHFSEK